MQEGLHKTEWKTYEPYLLLLSKFMGSAAISDYQNASHWEKVLLDKPAVVIDFLVQQGALELASLPAHINIKFKLVELKTLAKQNGLKVSGLKDELIERLVQHDEEAMRQSVSGLKVLICSTQGQQLAEQYISFKTQQKIDIETKLFHLLENQALEQATRLLCAYESSQVFSRGLNVDWQSPSTYDSLTRRLKLIFEKKPTLLKYMSDENLSLIRVATSMTCLLGESYKSTIRWLPSNFDTGLTYSVETVNRLLICHANYIQLIDDFTFHEIKAVKIHVVNDHLTCKACKALIGKKFKTNEAPELPHVLCTCEEGCRCSVVTADYDYVYE